MMLFACCVWGGVGCVCMMLVVCKLGLVVCGVGLVLCVGKGMMLVVCTLGLVVGGVGLVVCGVGSVVCV